MNTPLARRPDLHGFPLVLLFEDRKVIVVGAGKVASRKIDGLIAGGAKNITVISPSATDHIHELADKGIINYIEKKFEDSDLDGAFFALTATEIEEVNRAVFLAGEVRNIFVNSADDPRNCSSILMSTVRQGDVTIAISTAGKSPAFAKWLRRYLQGRLGPEYGILISLVNEERERVKAQGISSEDIDWDRAFDYDVVQMVKNDEISKVKEFISTLVENQIKEIPMISSDG